MMGSQPNPPAASGTDFMNQNLFGNDDAFGGQQDAAEDTGGAGWADAFGDDGNSYDLNFARAAMKEVLSASTPGNK